MKFLYPFFALMAFVTALHAAPSEEESLIIDCKSPLTVLDKNPEEARIIFEKQYQTTYQGGVADLKAFLRLLEDNSISPENPDHVTLVKIFTGQIARFYHKLDLEKVFTQLAPFFYPEKSEQTLKAFFLLTEAHLKFESHIETAMADAHKWEEGTHGDRLAERLESLFIQPKSSDDRLHHIQPGGTGFCGL